MIIEDTIFWTLEMPFLTRTTTADIHYVVEGDGPDTFLLFNGASLNLAFWGSLATRLASVGRVIRFDQRNAGKTRFEGTFSLNDVAADAAALMAEAHCDQAVVIGHAWGGRAAQVFARDYPHLVRGLVICANGGQFPPRETSTIDEQLRGARKSGDRAAWEQAYEARWCGQGFAERDPERFKEVADLGWQSVPNRTAKWDAKVSPSESYWGTTKAPCLLIYGDEDKNGTPENANDLHRRIEKSELVMLKNAGHFVVREQEDKVFDAIRGFTGRL